MKIYQRYIISQYIPPLTFGVVFFVSFLLTFQLFRIMRLVVGKNIPWGSVLELIGHICITFLPLAMPISLFFATIFTMNKLSQDSEFVAMRSFGLSKNKLFFPFLIISFSISMTLFALSFKIIPYSKKEFKNQFIKLTSRGMISSIAPENFFTEIPGVTLFSEKVGQNGTGLENIFIHLKGKRKNQFDQIIMAKKGKLIKIQDESAEFAVPSFRMFLQDGNILKVDYKKNNSEKILFKTYDFPIFSNKFSPGFVNRSSMLTFMDLHVNIEENKIKQLKLKYKDDLSGPERHELNELDKFLPKSQVEFWSRINNPLLCIILVWVGFCLGIKKGRGSSRYSGALVILTIILYYGVFFGLVSLTRKGNMPPFLAVILPSLVLALYGHYFYRRIDWQS